MSNVPKTPLSQLVPPSRTVKQCRAELRRRGVHHKGRRWEFTPAKAKKIALLLDH